MCQLGVDLTSLVPTLKTEGFMKPEEGVNHDELPWKYTWDRPAVIRLLMSRRVRSLLPLF